LLTRSKEKVEDSSFCNSGTRSEGGCKSTISSKQCVREEEQFNEARVVVTGFKCDLTDKQMRVHAFFLLLAWIVSHTILFYHRNSSW
jgi:hypothetical protein